MRLGNATRIALGLLLNLAALSLAAFGAAAYAQSSTDQPFPQPVAEQPFPQPAQQPAVETLHVTSREIVVDVMVTDSKGQPVRGLQQSDFTIEENGKPQPIRSFREFGSAIPVSGPAPPKLPPGVYTNSQLMPASGPVNVLLLDALHSNSFDIVRALQGASGYLSAMPQGTRVAIFWLSESGLHMLQGFTSDRDLLLRAARTSRTDIGACLTGQCLTRYQIDRIAIDAMNQIAAYVAGVDGRKNLLWITPGMPVDLMRDGGYGWSPPQISSRGGNSRGGVFGNDVAAPDMSVVHRLMDTYELFTAEQVAISPIDPRGVVGLSWATFKADEVAADSGGEALYNNNDLTAEIAKAIDDGSQFYTISYIPPKQKDDGHYHHIEVAVDQPGLHLVYRQGYNAERVPTPDVPALGPALMKASMEGNAPAATQILFDAGVWLNPLPAAAAPAAPPSKKAPKSKAPKTLRYEIHYGFPASQIAFTEGPDGRLHGSLEFDVVAYDIYRARVVLLTQTVTMPLSADQYREFAAKAFQFTQQIDLPPGEIALRLGILDKVSNKVGTLEVPLLVPPVRLAQRAAAQYVPPAPCPPRCPLPTAAPTATTTH